MPDHLCRQIVERGFYVAWDTARGSQARSDRVVTPETVPLTKTGEHEGKNPLVLAPGRGATPPGK